MLQIESSGSVKALFVDKDKLIEKVKSISEDLKAKFNYVKKIVLFGSLAKGKQRSTRDVDLIVIVSELDKDNFWDIYGELYNFIAEKIDMGIDLLIMTEKHFENKRKNFGEVLIL